MLRRLSWNLYLLHQIRGQKNVPFLSPEEMRRCQTLRVRRMVRYAFLNVPYYTDTMRRHGLAPEGIATVEDLARLPVIEKSDLQRDPEYYRSRTLRGGDCLELASSGSTGAPKKIYHDTAALFQNAAHGERERAIMVPVLGQWSGYRETVIVAPINASQRLIQEFCRRRGYFPGGVGVNRQYLLLSDSPERNLEKINEFRPQLLYSYGSYVEMLIALIRRKGVKWHRPKAVLYSSDALSASARRWLEEDNGVRVFTIYGAVEALKIAFECEQKDGLHANCDLYPLRVVTPQGRDAAPGESGEVILSNLVNRATVLLNYRLGDLVKVGECHCACGRTLPKISYPVGRVDEVLEVGHGELIHPIRFREIMNHVPGILQFQVKQLEDASVVITLVAADADRDSVEPAVLKGVEKEFAGALRATVKFADELERTARGKTPVVIAYRSAQA